jgi:hypothetical protein
MDKTTKGAKSLTCHHHLVVIHDDKHRNPVIWRPRRGESRRTQDYDNPNITLPLEESVMECGCEECYKKFESKQEKMFRKEWDKLKTMACRLPQDKQGLDNEWTQWLAGQWKRQYEAFVLTVAGWKKHQESKKGKTISGTYPCPVCSHINPIKADLHKSLQDSDEDNSSCSGSSDQSSCSESSDVSSCSAESSSEPSVQGASGAGQGTAGEQGGSGSESGSSRSQGGRSDGLSSTSGEIPVQLG